MDDLWLAPGIRESLRSQQARLRVAVLDATFIGGGILRKVVVCSEGRLTSASGARAERSNSGGMAGENASFFDQAFESLVPKN